jgi:hypothetical protein
MDHIPYILIAEYMCNIGQESLPRSIIAELNATFLPLFYGSAMDISIYIVTNISVRVDSGRT